MRGSVEARPQRLIVSNSGAVHGRLSPKHRSELMKEMFTRITRDAVGGSVPQIEQDILPQRVLRAFVERTAGVNFDVIERCMESLAF